jgi:hypothetical protein
MLSIEHERVATILCLVHDGQEWFRAVLWARHWTGRDLLGWSRSLWDATAYAAQIVRHGDIRVQT